MRRVKGKEGRKEGGREAGKEGGRKRVKKLRKGGRYSGVGVKLSGEFT